MSLVGMRQSIARMVSMRRRRDRARGVVGGDKLWGRIIESRVCVSVQEGRAWRGNQ